MSFYQSLALSFIMANLFCWISFYLLYLTAKWVKKFLIQNHQHRVCNSILKIVDKNQPYIKVEPFVTDEGVQVLMPESRLGIVENSIIIDQSEKLDQVDWGIFDTPTALRKGIIIW